MTKLKLTTFLLITLLFSGMNVFAQKHTTIVFRYNQDSIKQDALNYHLVKSLGNHSFGESDLYSEKLI